MTGTEKAVAGALGAAVMFLGVALGAAAGLPAGVAVIPAGIAGVLTLGEAGRFITTRTLTGCQDRVRAHGLDADCAEAITRGAVLIRDEGWSRMAPYGRSDNRHAGLCMKAAVEQGAGLMLQDGASDDPRLAARAVEQLGAYLIGHGLWPKGTPLSDAPPQWNDRQLAAGNVVGIMLAAARTASTRQAPAPMAPVGDMDGPPAPHEALYLPEIGGWPG